MDKLFTAIQTFFFFFFFFTILLTLAKCNNKKQEQKYFSEFRTFASTDYTFVDAKNLSEKLHYITLMHLIDTFIQSDQKYCSKVWGQYNF